MKTMNRFSISQAGLLLAGALFVLLAGLVVAEPLPPLQPPATQPQGDPPAVTNPAPLAPVIIGEPELDAFLAALPMQEDPFQTIDACATREMEQKGVPGAALAIAHNGEIIYERGYGVKHRATGGAVGAGTLFRIGSITKMMTAAAVLQQVERGKVHLDDPVTRFVPEFEVSGPWPASAIHIRHLLTHSSGFPDRFYFSDVDGPRGPHALSEWAGNQEKVYLYAPPGAFWNYSNPNFSLAGLVVERASGQQYAAYMKQQVWQPAGLEHTLLDPAEAMAYGDYSYGHFVDPFTGQPTIVAPDAYDNAWAAPAGYAFSTAGDLVKWAMLLMEGGHQVLTPASATAIQDRQISLHYTPDQFYGFGVITSQVWGSEVKQHGGNIPGWGAMLLWVPARQFAVAVLGNTTASLTETTVCAMAAVLGLEPQAPPDYPIDPSTWDAYTGSYQVLNYFLTQDPGGLEYEATVSKTDDNLHMIWPEVPDPFNPTVPFSRTLMPLYFDTFLMDLDLNGTPDLDVTFIKDPPRAEETQWLRSRVFVGVQAPIPAGTDTLTARAFVDYRCDGFFQTGLDVPMRDVTVTLRFPNGARQIRQTRSFGLVNFTGFDGATGASVDLRLPESYRGWALRPCFKGATNVRLVPQDFDRFGGKAVQFEVAATGEVAGP